MVKKTMQVIGLMSGTSADGIDAAWVQIKDEKSSPSLCLKGFKSYPFSRPLRNLILTASSHEKLTVDEICRLNFLLGEEFSNAVIKLCREFKISINQIDLIGSHGQTIKHLPPKSLKPVQFGSTLQIGEPSIIAERTGVTVVADFRPRDMAAGGQGAPLAPYLHYHLFHGLGYGISIQNIGGISNLTFIPKNGKMNDVIAFDTGPGNMLIDAVVSLLTHHKKNFDEQGRMASRGDIYLPLLKKLLSSPYLKQRPPKTTGREMFGHFFAEEIVKSLKKIKREDLIATATAFTAHSIADSYKRFIFPKYSVKEIVIGGGGAKNRTLYSMIQSLLPTVQLKRFEDFHMNSQAIEAMAFALLAHETIRSRASNLPNVTGARHGALLGKIIPGKNFGKIF